MQDSRGRYESEDEWRPYIDERDDGYDTQQWIGQPALVRRHHRHLWGVLSGFHPDPASAAAQPLCQSLVPIANQEDNYGHMRYNGVLQLQNA